MLGRKMICVECINCLCMNIANGIRLIDKIAIFLYRKRLHTRAFESKIPLKRHYIFKQVSQNKTMANISMFIVWHLQLSCSSHTRTLVAGLHVLEDK